MCAVYLCVSGCAGRGLEQSRVVTLHWRLGTHRKHIRALTCSSFFSFALFGRAFFLYFLLPHWLCYRTIAYADKQAIDQRRELPFYVTAEHTQLTAQTPILARLPFFFSFFFLSWRKCKTGRKELEEKDDDSGQGNNLKLNCQERSCETGKTAMTGRLCTAFFCVRRDFKSVFSCFQLYPLKRT